MKVYGSDSSELKNNVGFCPQDNLLFPWLTTLDHLIFFGMVCITCIEVHLERIKEFPRRELFRDDQILNRDIFLCSVTNVASSVVNLSQRMPTGPSSKLCTGTLLNYIVHLKKQFKKKLY